MSSGGDMSVDENVLKTATFLVWQQTVSNMKYSLKTLEALETHLISWQDSDIRRVIRDSLFMDIMYLMDCERSSEASVMLYFVNRNGKTFSIWHAIRMVINFLKKNYINTFKCTSSEREVINLIRESDELGQWMMMKHAHVTALVKVAAVTGLLQLQD